MRGNRAVLGLLGLVLSSWLGEARVLAQPRAGRASLAEAEADLGSGEVARIERGLHALGASGQAAAVAPIEDFVRSGPPAATLLPAIEALGALGRTEASAILSSLLRHRRVDARARAAVALAPLRSERASTALAIALGDPDASVREAAALALATAGTPTAVPPLLAALARGNVSAAPALGALGEPETLEQIVALGEAVPPSALAAAAHAFLQRTDLSTRQLMRGVDVVAPVGSPEITEVLRAVRADRARVRALAAHIDEALQGGTP